MLDERELTVDSGKIGARGATGLVGLRRHECRSLALGRHAATAHEDREEVPSTTRVSAASTVVGGTQVVDTLTLPLAAFAAGVVSFSSPCCVPLVPAYLSYVSALPASDVERERAQRVVVHATVLFVLGFTVVFTLLGISFAFVGAALTRQVPWVLKIAGVFIIVAGLAMAGILRIPLLARERRIDLARVPSGPKGAFPLGMAYAFGWTPCIGPVLATVLTTASATGTAAWGAFLLVCYSLGLGLPFIGLAVGFQRARGSLDWLRRHSRTIERAGGLMLALVGVLFVTGAWRGIFLPLQREFARLGWPPI